MHFQGQGHSNVTLCSPAYFKIEQRLTHRWRSVSAGHRGEEKGLAREPPWQGLWPESKCMQTTSFQRGARQPEHRPHIFNEPNFFLPPSLPLPPPSFSLFFLPHSYLLTISQPDSVLGIGDTHSQLSRPLQLVSNLPIKHALWEHRLGKAPNAGPPPPVGGLTVMPGGGVKGRAVQSKLPGGSEMDPFCNPTSGSAVRAAGLPPLPACAAYKGDAWPYWGSCGNWAGMWPEHWEF